MNHSEVIPAKKGSERNGLNQLQLEKFSLINICRNEALVAKAHERTGEERILEYISSIDSRLKTIEANIGTQRDQESRQKKSRGEDAKQMVTIGEQWTTIGAMKELDN